MSKRFDRWRASYASDPEKTLGRLHPEQDSPTRSDFQRDRDRIIHSTAFRRLKHKTQVFVYHEGDHYRTRLTHTIEVAQISRSLARALGLDEDLAEALALAHDLGHTPFGHTGEDALNACMSGRGGFDHNAQALRIVTHLERRYPDFDGLNLCWETLEGLVKHNGPLLDGEGQGIGSYTGRPIPEEFLSYDKRQSLRLNNFAGAEAQIAAISDDIAYNAHDIDDGLRAGFFSLDDLKSVPFLATIIDEIFDRWPDIEISRAIHELGRRLITCFVEGVIKVSHDRLLLFAGQDVEHIRKFGRPVAAFSDDLALADREIKAFLFAKMYRQKDVLRIRGQAEQVVSDLFMGFSKNHKLLPDEWRRTISYSDACRTVVDYIAGMTDRFALSEHKRLFDETPELR
ncbi:MAG: deoxyguanosinetriphosphate triphosphohydrolase [Hyphomicrobiales bacterium]